MPVIEITKLKAMLLALRDENGKRIPQHRVAGAIGLSPSTLSAYALGQSPFTYKNLRLLCDYFQCDNNDLAGWIRYEIPDED